ncbi:MAG TPA: RimK/LysX family protein [Wenzhouxiangella sp.]|nr:RimK/LysX family protein [Wenzhouxiangella sp.]
MSSTWPSLIIGACEWVALPELGIKALRARVDTGAKSCALHAGDIRTFESEGRLRVAFSVAIGFKSVRRWHQCEADLLGTRRVRNTSGEAEERYTIRTPLVIGASCWEVDVTLTDRDKMRYRMLLGRSAMKNNALVNPARAFLQGKPRIPA